MISLITINNEYCDVIIRKVEDQSFILKLISAIRLLGGLSFSFFPRRKCAVAVSCELVPEKASSVSSILTLCAVFDFALFAQAQVVLVACVWSVMILFCFGII